MERSMRVTLVLILLLAAAAVAAYITRPGQGLHRGVAVALMEEGAVAAPGEAGRYAFDDFYVVTRSTMTSGDGKRLECWGVYTRFLCLGPAAPATGQVTGQVTG
jgi:hypothetical protein